MPLLVFGQDVEQNPTSSPCPPYARLQVLQRIGGAFKPGSAVIARSSANVEDLAGMSGEI